VEWLFYLSYKQINKKYFMDTTSITSIPTLLDSRFPSLCIPRVFSNISKDKVFKIFQKTKLGVIDRIDMIPIRPEGGGTEYQRVFVHFKSWNPTAHEWRERLISGKDIKVVYNEPWIWKVSASRSYSKKCEMK
jgi:hypothetical protein